MSQQKVVFCYTKTRVYVHMHILCMLEEKTSTNPKAMLKCIEDFRLDLLWFPCLLLGFLGASEFMIVVFVIFAHSLAFCESLASQSELSLLCLFCVGT